MKGEKRETRRKRGTVLKICNLFTYSICIYSYLFIDLCHSHYWIPGSLEQQSECLTAHQVQTRMNHLLNQYRTLQITASVIERKKLNNIVTSDCFNTVFATYVTLDNLAYDVFTAYLCLFHVKITSTICR